MDWKNRSVHYRRLAGLGVIGALLVTTLTPAMAASPASPTDPPSFSTKSITKAMAHATPDSRLRAERAVPEAPKTQAAKSGSFFKTRTGLMVIAVMAVGTGYALYSSKEDRIRGSIR